MDKKSQTENWNTVVPKPVLSKATQGTIYDTFLSLRDTLIYTKETYKNKGAATLWIDPYEEKTVEIKRWNYYQSATFANDNQNTATLMGNTVNRYGAYTSSYYTVKDDFVMPAPYNKFGPHALRGIEIQVDGIYKLEHKEEFDLSVWGANIAQVYSALIVFRPNDYKNPTSYTPIPFSVFHRGQKKTIQNRYTNMGSGTDYHGSRVYISWIVSYTDTRLSDEQYLTGYCATYNTLKRWDIVFMMYAKNTDNLDIWVNNQYRVDATENLYGDYNYFRVEFLWPTTEEVNKDTYLTYPQ